MTRAALAAALLVVLVASALSGAAVAAKPGGTLRMVFMADPPTLDPAHATDLTSSAVIRQVFDALLELDEKLVPAPALAERWMVSADHRAYTFHLRRGAKFHNGREVRAADVKYSFERAARGKRPWVFEKLVGAREFIQGGAPEIAGVRVVDDATVELRLERPFAPFLHLIAYDAASIVPREEADRRGAGFASHPVGTGAFRFGSWRRDDQVVLERFPEHFRGPANLERVVFRVIPAEATRFNEYAAGQLDVSDIPTGRCRALQADPKLKADVAIWPTLGTSALRFNVERAPFTDARVRRAIAHAIDPAIIVNRVLEGCVAPAQGIVPPVLAGWTATAKRLPLDRERARSLLAEAGFPGGRGLGPLAYHFNTGDLNQRIAEALQAQLKEVGVALELRRLDWAAHIKVVDDGSAGFFRQGWIADYPDPENFLTVLFHSRNVGPPGNTSRYRNPAVDRLFDEADTMAPGAQRVKRYQEAEQVILDDAAWVSLYHYASRALIKPHVKGLERSPQSTAPEFLAPLRKVWLER
ncbi:MAG: ABC transporter substrate-binding protein [Candidatus Rokuibacteriota bacterium]|nr:MAG: ABC transporter substrate-binding protein [Candidatus Rokubacteria bacterium]